MSESLPWMQQARAQIGAREVPGPKHNPLVLLWWRLIRRGGIKSDEVPWCSAFVGAMFEQVGMASTRYESARSWLDWGRRLPEPAYGCVVVLARGPGQGAGGHVGFVAGADVRGRLLVLGGNQGDAVSIVAFDRARVLGYRWPALVPLPDVGPLAQGDAPQSTTEA